MQTSRRVLYLPDDLWDKLTAEADRLGTTASFVAREALMVRLEPEPLLTEQTQELSYRMAFDKVVAPREHTPGAGQIRLANGQAVDLGSGINAMAPGRAQETREDG